MLKGVVGSGVRLLKCLEFLFSERPTHWTRAGPWLIVMVSTHTDERMHVTSRCDLISVSLQRKRKLNHYLLSATVEQIYGSQVLYRHRGIGSCYHGWLETASLGETHVLRSLQGTGKGANVDASAAGSIYSIGEEIRSLIIIQILKEQAIYHDDKSVASAKPFAHRLHAFTC